MKNDLGFVRVAAASPRVVVADPVSNIREIIKLAKQADIDNVKIMVFPELCVSGYTCGDLFLHDLLIKKSAEAVSVFISETASVDCLFALGYPMQYSGKLYNVMGIIKDGKLLGIVPKKNLPNYQEFYETRHFEQGESKIRFITWNGYDTWFGTELLFENTTNNLVIAAEVCEDLLVPIPQSTKHAMAGANMILNSSASNEIIGKGDYRKQLVSSQSSRLISAYVYANAGDGESTQDLVFSGHNLIAENGTILAEAKYKSNTLLISDIDMDKLVSERRRMTTYKMDKGDYHSIPFEYRDVSVTDTKRKIDKHPFIPNDQTMKINRFEEILYLQALGLKKRMEHIGCKKAIIGISGGLDSTLALLVVSKTFDLLGLDRSGILGITMPCFGTTSRTYQNACNLVRGVGGILIEIPIEESVKQHLKDIKHPEDAYDITYENAQARERTQVLMDLANQENGIVIGTGDLSELVLGWCTYNGDHMSMYAVNVDIPKTLVKHLVQYYETDDERSDLLIDTLYDILDTPVSPELLPPDKVTGKITQKTEHKIGPYELHDFFLYYLLRFGYSPKKIYTLAEIAFKDDYSKEEILKWLNIFFKRFFSQQFKRSCLPDGPKIGSVGISPRGDLRMPSDASVHIWEKELEKLLETK
jgi:NAD+ synthase (glutamine-hydrolysing)